MDARTRVLSALSHIEPDKIPVDFSGHRSSGIAAIAYSNLRKYLGLADKPIRVYDVIQQLAVVDDDILDFFAVDTIELGRGFLQEDNHWKEWVLPDGTPCLIPEYVRMLNKGEDWYILSASGQALAIQKKGCLYFEQYHYPLENVDFYKASFNNIEEAFDECMWMTVVHPGAHLELDEAGLAALSKGAKALRERTDRAIIGLFGGSIFEVPQYLFKNEKYLAYMAFYPDAVHRLSEKLTSLYLKNLEKWMGAVGPYIDIVLFGGEDMGGQNGPLFSPEMYREFYKPYHRKLWTRAKELADVRVQLHCCGGIRPILDDLIEAGIDAVNPVQITSAGMNTMELKKDFGGRLTLWGGGCDTRDILPHGTPEAVKKHVTEQLTILGKGGGFVFQQVHNIMANVPAENIVAMYQAVNSFA